MLGIVEMPLIILARRCCWKGVFMNVTMKDIRQAIRMLDLADQPLCVHSSLRSFGRVEAGAQTILKVDKCGTVFEEGGFLRNRSVCQRMRCVISSVKRP